MMEMVEVKTADLIGPALDWAVATVDGLSIHALRPGGFAVNCEDYSPSTDWSQGGPLIEKYGIGVARFYEPVDGPILHGVEWAALWSDDKKRGDGPSPLVAACRAIVAAKLGEVVSVPADLVACPA